MKHVQSTRLTPDSKSGKQQKQNKIIDYFVGHFAYATDSQPAIMAPTPRIMPTRNWGTTREGLAILQKEPKEKKPVF